MKRTYMLMCVSACLWGLPKARGQSIGPSTINAAGGTGTIGSTIFDWSIGEMTMVSTFTGSSIIVTQGLLQNNKSAASVPTVSMGDQVRVFPNPANTVVNVQYTAATQGVLTYRLMDMAGRVIINHHADIPQGLMAEQLNISELAAATYLLEVSFKADNATGEMTSFKIDKLK